MVVGHVQPVHVAVYHASVTSEGVSSQKEVSTQFLEYKHCVVRILMRPTCTLHRHPRHAMYASIALSKFVSRFLAFFFIFSFGIYRDEI